MGGLRFLPFHPEHAKELGSDRAELYFEYLKLCSSQKFCRKDEDGFFTRSVSQIQASIGQRKTVQQAARKLLIEKGWIECKITVSTNSPTVGFRIVGQKPVKGIRKARIATEADKSRARQQLQRAVNSGKVTREPCEICDSEPSEAHHNDYNKPLDVVWLCSRHHHDEHVKIRAGLVDNYVETVDYWCTTVG